MPTRQPTINMTFVCAKCHEEKTEPRKRYKKRKVCKSCRKVRSEGSLENNRRRSAEWYAANRERSAISRKANHLKNIDKVRERRKLRYQRERTEAIASARLWETQNPERTKKRKRDWELANVGKVKASQAAIRAKRPIGSFTYAEIQNLLRIQNGLCIGCQCLIVGCYHIDHVIPIARDGTNTIDNIQLLCGKCNRQKSARDPYEWANSIGRLFV